MCIKGILRYTKLCSFFLAVNYYMSVLQKWMMRLASVIDTGSSARDGSLLFIAIKSRRSFR